MEQITAQPQISRTVPFQNQKQEQQINGTHPSTLPWIHTAKGHPYFFTENGENWTPIGQNDAITWPELKGLFRRRDTATAEAYLAMLAQNGVTCMRLMLEYCQSRYRYIENPVGEFNTNMVGLWDDLFLLCGKYGIRILLTPYDTFWMWLRWKHHPYHTANGGTCSRQGQWLLCKETRAAIKRRLAFATKRWGGSGVLFAWDLWNEIHPAHAGNSIDIFPEFIEDISSFLRQTEQRLHGRAHPQTVSLFGPVLHSHPTVAQSIFRQPALDFASVHFYESGTIDHPRNTVDAAIAMGRLTRDALTEIKDNRPFFDSEHGPIHSFKDKRITLPEVFDDEYFRHLQWAHFASGGAGGGMRWPNRHPHSLTAGMRAAQRALSGFLPLIQWQQFRRTNWNGRMAVSDKAVEPFGCGDENQAIFWILRKDSVGKEGLLHSGATAVTIAVKLPMTIGGSYTITAWDTEKGKPLFECSVQHQGSSALSFQLPPIITDMAFAVKRSEGLR